MIELTVMPEARAVDSCLSHDIRRVLPWRSWAEGLAESRELGKPVLCLAESPWSNSAQRLALFLAEDEQLSDAAASDFVPVLLDPADRPEVADRILVAASRLESIISPPLLAVLTEEGLPLVTYCNLAFEGDDNRPSLLGLLHASSAHYIEQPRECIVEARGLQQMPEAAAGARDLFLPAWSLLRQADSGLVRQLLDAGITDQLDGTFHRAARMSGWGVPHFEKTAVQNAAMANALLDVEPEQALHCARFALHCLRARSAGLASDTPYYTWASSEVLESLPARELQLVGLHYRITASSSRHVLNQVRSVEEAVSLAAGSTEEEARQALEQGKLRLQAVRQQRRPPVQLPEASRTEQLLTVEQLLRFSWRRPGSVSNDELINLLNHNLESSAPGESLHEHAAALLTVQTAVGREPHRWLRALEPDLRERLLRFRLERDWYYDRSHTAPVPAAIPEHTLPSVGGLLQQLRLD